MDLISITQTKLLNAVDSVQPRSGYKTVVVDEAGQRLLDMCIEKHVLLDRKCANVMAIDAKRATENYLDVIYIVEPNGFAVECIKADYKLSPPRYAEAHVFLLADSTSVVNELQSKLGNRLGSIRVADFAVYPLERQIFSLGDPYASDMLYNAHNQLNLKYMNQMAGKLHSVVSAFGPDPIIRYWNPAQGYEKSNLPKVLADLLNDRVSEALAATSSSSSPHRTQVLILDRSIDQLSPLLHDFTLQALAYDLLPFQDNKYLTEPGGVLDDKDLEWLTLKHQHISFAIEELTKRVAELKAANPHFGNSDSQVKVSDIRNMMAALPEFVKSKDSMAINLQVATDCMDTVEKNRLMQIADLEQAFALQSDSDGRKLGAEAVDQLIEFLGDKTLQKEIKLRLLMIYIISRQSGLLPQDYELLRHHAQLEPYELEMIQNIACWGTPAIKQSVSGPESKNPIFYTENTEEQLLYARISPGLKHILDGILQNRLDSRLFPVIGDDATVNDPGITAANSLRNPRQRATWARPSGATAQKPKIIVFILGGFTAAERRVAYQVSASGSRDIILGGTDDLNPSKYVRFLARQRLAREYLGLPCDMPAKRAPKHLYESDQKPKPAQAPQSKPRAPAAAPVQTTIKPKADVLKDPGVMKKDKEEKKKLRFFKR